MHKAPLAVKVSGAVNNYPQFLRLATCLYFIIVNINIYLGIKVSERASQPQATERLINSTPSVQIEADPHA